MVNAVREREGYVEEIFTMSDEHHAGDDIILDIPHPIIIDPKAKLVGPRSLDKKDDYVAQTARSGQIVVAHKPHDVTQLGLFIPLKYEKRTVGIFATGCSAVAREWTLEKVGLFQPVFDFLGAAMAKK